MMRRLILAASLLAVPTLVVARQPAPAAVRQADTTKKKPAAKPKKKAMKKKGAAKPAAKDTAKAKP
jgi:hypothetical protein